MTPEQIYRALCEIDPALEPWQKCEHDIYRREEDNTLVCRKCGLEEYQLEDTPFGLPIIGDGKPRYQTVELLLELCERLGVEAIDASMSLPPNIPVVRLAILHVLKWSSASSTEQAPLSEKCVRVLQEAILRSVGRWTE